MFCVALTLLCWALHFFVTSPLLIKHYRFLVTPTFLLFWRFCSSWYPNFKTTSRTVCISSQAPWFSLNSSEWPYTFRQVLTILCYSYFKLFETTHPIIFFQHDFLQSHHLLLQPLIFFLDQTIFLLVMRLCERFSLCVSWSFWGFSVGGVGLAAVKIIGDLSLDWPYWKILNVFNRGLFVWVLASEVDVLWVNVFIAVWWLFSLAALCGHWGMFTKGFDVSKNIMIIKRRIEECLWSLLFELYFVDMMGKWWGFWLKDGEKKKQSRTMMHLVLCPPCLSRKIAKYSKVKTDNIKGFTRANLPFQKSRLRIDKNSRRVKMSFIFVARTKYNYWWWYIWTAHYNVEN